MTSSTAPTCSGSRSSATTRSGNPKAALAADFVRALNPHVDVAAILQRLTADNAEALLAGHDLVIDGCDNFATRLIVERHAHPAWYSAGLRGGGPVPGTGRALPRLGSGQALLPLLRRRRVRHRRLRHLRRARRARSAHGDGRKLRRADGDPRNRRHRRGRRRQPVPVRRRDARLAENPPAEGPELPDLLGLSLLLPRRLSLRLGRRALGGLCVDPLDRLLQRHRLGIGRLRKSRVGRPVADVWTVAAGHHLELLAARRMRPEHRNRLARRALPLAPRLRPRRRASTTAAFMPVSNTSAVEFSRAYLPSCSRYGP